MTGNKCYLQDVKDIQVEAEIKLNCSSTTAEEVGESRMTATILQDVPTDDDADRTSLTPVTNVPLLPTVFYQINAATETI
jgi:hypothetical protein